METGVTKVNRLDSRIRRLMHWKIGIGSVVGAMLLLWLGPTACMLLKYATITKRKLPHPNPTSYVFHSSLDRVREIIRKYDQRERLGCTVYDPDFTVCGPSVGENRVKMDQLHLLKSDVYFWLGSPLYYRAEFALAYRPIGDGMTEVRVETSESEVRIGPSFTFTGGDLYRPVPPTTIEEYGLLRTLGCLLGERDMPPVHVP